MFRAVQIISTFPYIKDLPDYYNKAVIRTYSVSSYGKGIVDHVRDLVKMAICQKFAAGAYVPTPEVAKTEGL